MGAVRGSVQRRPSARHRRHVGLAAGGAIDASAACRTRARRACLPRMPRCTSGPRADAEARPLGRRNTTAKHREEASRFPHFPACFHERTRAFFQRPCVKGRSSRQMLRHTTRARCWEFLKIPGLDTPRTPSNPLVALGGRGPRGLTEPGGHHAPGCWHHYDPVPGVPPNACPARPRRDTPKAWASLISWPTNHPACHSLC